MSDASEKGDPALIGRRIAGKFHIEKFLGGGAMGAVYRAMDTSLDRNVALKVMHPAIAIDPTFVTRFHREARAASRVDHANAMRVIEFGEEPDGLLYIAMEYLQGRDLYRVIHEDWPLPEPRIADIMSKALAAMAVAHDMGVIHRDLKPENVMILDRKDDEGHDIVKVCDFGIAKIADSDDDVSRKTAGAKLTTTGLVVGTPEYMSPEQARGEKLDARSDLYSLGIILYQLLTGRTPFLADTALAVVLKHITDEPEPPAKHYPNVHKGLEAVCMKALAKARDQRWQSAREMRTAIRATMEGRPLPVDMLAPTEGAGTGPNMPAQSASQPVPVLQSAQSKTTPLGTSVASTPNRKSGVGRWLAIGLGSMVAGSIGFVLYDRPHGAHHDTPVTATTTAPTATAEPAKPADPLPTASAAPTATTMDLTPTVPNGHQKRHAKPAAEAPVAANDPPAAPTTEPPPPPPPPVEAATTTPAPVAAPPPWSAASCKAMVTGHHSTNGALSAKDLKLSGVDAAWTGCAKSAIASKPAGPINASVHLKFSDNRQFRGATCTSGCDSALAACIASHTTGNMASIHIQSGDVTGEPEFEVSAQFSCD